MKRPEFLGIAALAFAPLHEARAQATGGDVSVAYAGSLVDLMEKSVGPAFSATGYTFRGEAKGSTAIANLIRDGLRTPDVFVSADQASIFDLFGITGHDHARWMATFATARIQIAYSPKSPHARVFADAAAGKMTWYEALQTPGLRAARTDPAADPKGYRVLLVLALAEKFYELPGLSQKLLGDPENTDQILPEESAAARLETGDIDALWVYSSEAVSRGYPVLRLPPQIDLGEPSFAKAYSSVVVSVGTKAYHGMPIVYAVTIPIVAKNYAGAAAFVDFLIGPRGRELVEKSGLTPIAPFVVGPQATIPPDIRVAISEAQRSLRSER